MRRSEIKRRPLSDAVIEKLEPEATEYREHDGGGLYLRVKPNGTKTWQLRFKRADGRWSWAGLGPYGRASHQLNAAKARAKARQILQDSGPDGDALQTKRAMQQSAQEKTENTFEALAAEWFATKAKGWTPETATRVWGGLKRHVFPKFGARPYVEIRASEWMNLFRRMEETGVIEQTKRTRAVCRDILDLARVTDRLESNQLESMHKFLTSRKATPMPHVRLEELPELLRAIHRHPTPDVRIGLLLMAMLACRPSELREAVWSEFNLRGALWTIPAARMKRRREHLIPLPRQAVTLLTELHHINGKYPLLFPGRSNTTRPKSETVFIMALRRLGYEGKQTPHGFRHLFSTIAHEAGHDTDAIEAQLSHLQSGVRGVYNRAEYLPQRKILMQWYADYLTALASAQ